MEKERKASTVFVQVVERPERKLILLRGIKSTHYFEYCEEVGCDVWGILSSISEALFEPAGFWLPKHLIAEGTSQYVQGVEVPLDYQGEAIEDLWKVMNEYDPKLYGFTYADEDGPRFQLEPQGFRGYIEGRSVRSLLK